MSPALFFILKMALTIQGLLQLRTHFRTIFSSSVKNAMEVLIVIASTLQIA